MSIKHFKSLLFKDSSDDADRCDRCIAEKIHVDKTRGIMRNIYRFSASLSGLSWQWARGSGYGKSNGNFRYPFSRISIQCFAHYNRKFSKVNIFVLKDTKDIMYILQVHEEKAFLRVRKKIGLLPLLYRSSTHSRNKHMLTM